MTIACGALTGRRRVHRLDRVRHERQSLGRHQGRELLVGHGGRHGGTESRGVRRVR